MTGSELADALGLDRAAIIKAWRQAYVRREDEPDDDLYRVGFHSIGIDDDVNITFLLRGWAHLRELRADLPGEPSGAKPDEPKQQSPAQRSLIVKMCRERKLEAPDEAFPLTFEEASGIIDAIKAGTYDPKKYEVPF